MNSMTIAIIGLWVAAVGQTIFVILYGSATPWRTGFIGRALFFKSSVLWVALVNPLVNYYWHYPHQMEVSAGLICLLAFAVIYQTAALAQRLWLDRHGPQA